MDYWPRLPDLVYQDLAIDMFWHPKTLYELRMYARVDGIDIAPRNNTDSTGTNTDAPSLDQLVEEVVEAIMTQSGTSSATIVATFPAPAMVRPGTSNGSEDVTQQQRSKRARVEEQMVVGLPVDHNGQTMVCHHKHDIAKAHLPASMVNMELEGCCKPLEPTFELFRFIQGRTNSAVFGELREYPDSPNRIKMFHHVDYNPFRVCIARRPNRGASMQFTDLPLDITTPDTIGEFIRWYASAAGEHRAKLLALACIQRLSLAVSANVDPPAADPSETRKYNFTFATHRYPAMLTIRKTNNGTMVNMNVLRDTPHLVFFMVATWVKQQIKIDSLLQLFVSISTTPADVVVVENGQR